MSEFRVVDMRRSEANELHQSAKSPEEAARLALGMDLTRAGVPRNLVCRVYWSDQPGSTNMVRLYQRATDRQRQRH
ncbi:hypothetical protein SAMN06295905_1312 [Devosia lucknowensis]|uniref:Uncharacterized protein n=1 Tax=Devosia lucknowensis TaxID=1096929 RepID=A0A1Y6EXP6_9HYPH|nr:hypothetical protein [Devosia lucknowensis]SMQ65770.1 hypothetical protein SAMN06295905_1312 [Devosia lucknowensis]